MNLTGQSPASTYQNLLVIDNGRKTFSDGTGSVVSFGSASYVASGSVVQTGVTFVDGVSPNDSIQVYTTESVLVVANVTSPNAFVGFGGGLVFADQGFQSLGGIGFYDANQTAGRVAVWNPSFPALISSTVLIAELNTLSGINTGSNLLTQLGAKMSITSSKLFSTQSLTIQAGDGTTITYNLGSSSMMVQKPLTSGFSTNAYETDIYTAQTGSFPQFIQIYGDNSGDFFIAASGSSPIGTGNFTIQHNGQHQLIFGTNATGRWSILGSGDFVSQGNHSISTFNLTASQAVVANSITASGGLFTGSSTVTSSILTINNGNLNFNWYGPNANTLGLYHRAGSPNEDDFIWFIDGGATLAETRIFEKLTVYDNNADMNFVAQIGPSATTLDAGAIVTDGTGKLTVTNTFWVISSTNNISTAVEIDSTDDSLGGKIFLRGDDSVNSGQNGAIYFREVDDFNDAAIRGGHAVVGDPTTSYLQIDVGSTNTAFALTQTSLTTLPITASLQGTASWAANARTASNGAVAYANYMLNGTTITNGEQYNIASITRLATGQHAVIFTTAFTTATYAVTINAQSGSNSAPTASFASIVNKTTTGFTASFQLLTNIALADPTTASFAIFGF